MAKTDQEQERVRYELDLFKTYAMLDVLVFLKYLIDTLRAKFEKENQPEKLKILDDINAYVEDLEKYYSSA